MGCPINHSYGVLWITVILLSQLNGMFCDADRARRNTVELGGHWLMDVFDVGGIPVIKKPTPKESV